MKARWKRLLGPCSSESSKDRKRAAGMHALSNCMESQCQYRYVNGQMEHYVGILKFEVQLLV